MTNLGIEVPLGQIGKQLKAFSDGDTSRTNACMMNLAVFTEDVSQLEKNFSRIDTLTRDHSCRALSVALDRNAAEKGIKSWVTAHCNMTNGKKTVCCEQISFLLTGYSVGRLRNTVFANLNSDLPLVFWWQGELTDVFEPGLTTIIDRFIFDSGRWEDPKACYLKVLDAASDVKKRFVIQDLAWTRSYHFRLAFASIFDQVAAQQEFSKITTVFIQVGEQYRTSGLLLLAWLANQAGWTLSERCSAEYFLFTSAEGRSIQAELSCAGEQVLAEFGVASEEASFFIQKSPNENFLHHVIQTGSCVQENTSLAGKQDSVALVADQLSRGGKNALLRKTLPLFLELV